MKKYCMLPFEEFWAQLEASLHPRYVLSAYAGTEVDTRENRVKAYNALMDELRRRGELCEHLSHGHKRAS